MKIVWVRLSPYKIFLGSTRTFDPFLFHLIVHLNTEDVDIVEEDGQDGKGNEEVAENSNISSPDLDTKGHDYIWRLDKFVEPVARKQNYRWWRPNPYINPNKNLNDILAWIGSLRTKHNKTTTKTETTKTTTMKTATMKTTTKKTSTMKTTTHNPSNKWECAWSNPR